MLEPTRLFLLIFLSFGTILMIPRSACASGPVAVSGVVTTSDHQSRLGDLSVGLYADKEKSGGRLASDRTASRQGDNSQPVDIGVYCLTYPNTGSDVKYLWVLLEYQDQTAHPQCAQLNDAQPIRTAKASDLVLLPKEKASLTLESASNFIAAAIETSAV